MKYKVILHHELEIEANSEKEAKDEYYLQYVYAPKNNSAKVVSTNLKVIKL